MNISYEVVLYIGKHEERRSIGNKELRKLLFLTSEDASDERVYEKIIRGNGMKHIDENLFLNGYYQELFSIGIFSLLEFKDGGILEILSEFEPTIEDDGTLDFMSFAKIITYSTELDEYMITNNFNSKKPFTFFPKLN